MCGVCDMGTADVCQVRSAKEFVFWLSIVIKWEGIISYSKDQKMMGRNNFLLQGSENGRGRGRCQE